DVIAGVGRGADLDAAGHVFRAEITAPFPGGDHDMHFEALGVQAHAFGTVEAHRPNVSAGQVVPAHGFALCAVEGVLVERNLHAHDMGGAEQPVGVVAQPEDRRAVIGLVSPEAFEYTAAVMQG